jgi:hypothetical protein
MRGMSYWGFWEWLTYSCIAIAAVVLALDQAIKGSPELIVRFSTLLKARTWSYAPLALIGLSGLLLVGQHVGVIGTKVQNVEAGRPRQQPGFVKTSVRLQFFGDRRIPLDVARENVATWFAYYSPSIKVTPQDPEGKAMAGGFEVPPNWVVLIVFDQPTDYRQAVATFSNPEIAPPIEVRHTTTRSVVVTTGGLLPAGVLEVHLIE